MLVFFTPGLGLTEGFEFNGSLVMKVNTPDGLTTWTNINLTPNEALLDSRSGYTVPPSVRSHALELGLVINATSPMPLEIWGYTQDQDDCSLERVCEIVENLQFLVTALSVRQFIADALNAAQAAAIGLSALSGNPAALALVVGEVLAPGNNPIALPSPINIALPDIVNVL